MPLADIINAIFEFSAGAFVIGHCAQIKKDEAVAGLSIVAVIFFTSWGYWNLYYYPSLGQIWSFFGGIAVVSANTAWLFLLFKYAKKDQLPAILWPISLKIKARNSK